MADLLNGTSAEGNSTATFSWEPQPARRGTFSIISTCLVTLALCTWKIVHLNLPGVCPQADLSYSAWWKRGTTTKRHRLVHIFGGHQVTRQIGWLLIALFTPELVAFTAFEQYWDARSLQKYMERVYLLQSPGSNFWSGRSRRDRRSEVDVESDDEAARRVWTITHSWYAVMGGYCYHLPEALRAHLPEDHDRRELALRDEALRFVARNEPSVIPRLTVNAIMDKSTAGAFVKIITLFQALWFILQCLARMSASLPLSLLELMTFAHCIVGLVIGWLWLNKPLNISQADPLDMPEAGGAPEPHWLMAILYTLSSFDGEEADEERFEKMDLSMEEEGEEERGVEEEYENKEEADSESDRTLREDDSGYQVYLEPVMQHSPMYFDDLGLDVSLPARPPSSRSVTGKAEFSETTPTTSRPGTGARGPPSNPRPQTAPKSPHTSSSVTAANSLLGSISTRPAAAADANLRIRHRMQIAQKGWEHYVLRHHPSSTATARQNTTTTGHDHQDDQQDKTLLIQRRLKRAFRNTLVDRVPNFPRRRHSRRPGEEDPLGRQHTLRTHLGTTLTGFLYGGLHLLAWNAEFHTPAESALWRAAALSLAASGLLVPVTHAQGFFHRVVRPWKEEEGEERETTAWLAEMEMEMAGARARSMGVGGRGQDGWRGCWWGVREWCLLWMKKAARVLKVLLMAVIAVVYFGLRVFIFVECLVNLAHLQPSAYDVVIWSQYVPHIG